MPHLTSTQRNDYVLLLQQAHEKAVSGRIADSKDQLAVDIYLNIKALAKKTIMEIGFVMRKNEGFESLEGDLRHIIAAFEGLLGKQWEPKSGQKPKIDENIALRRQDVAALGIEVSFIPEQPLSREMLIKELKTGVKQTESELETLADEYKSREILNYFTDIGAVQGEKGDILLTMISTAYANFTSFTTTLFTAHIRLFTYLQANSCSIPQNPSLTLDFQSQFSTFPAISPRRDLSSDPSDSPMETEAAETLYLEQSRLKARTAWPKPAFRRKIQPKKTRFQRFLSRETSPKSKLMHEFWSELKQSTQKIEALKAQESFFVTSGSMQSLVSYRSLQRVKSVPTSPKAVRPFSRYCS